MLILLVWVKPYNNQKAKLNIKSDLVGEIPQGLFCSKKPCKHCVFDNKTEILFT